MGKKSRGREMGGELEHIGFIICRKMHEFNCIALLNYEYTYESGGYGISGLTSDS